jgi:hypothetical protein
MDHLRYNLTNARERLLWRSKYPCPFARFLSYERAAALSSGLGHVFQRNINVREIDQVAGRFRRIESAMEGRIAGDLDDHILNYFMVRDATSVGDGRAVHGEIGVLFGGSLIMALFAVRESNTERIVVAIDPLDGYYGNQTDPLTRQRLDEGTVRRNIERLGPPKANVQLITSLSQSEQTLSVVRDMRFASIWIDGDHSYEGIKRDWANYSRLVLPNGYVLIDNYHDQQDEYPGIDRFIDVELLPALQGWEVAFRLGRSILFRKLP